MTTTHPHKSWREIYEAQRKVSPEKRTVNYTPRLGLADVPIASFLGKARISGIVLSPADQSEKPQED
ncbi:MAG: hypothetical protein ACRBBQ_13640 [Cognatishimia sp.]